MIIKLAFVAILSLVSVTTQSVDRKSSVSLTKRLDQSEAKVTEDLLAQESGKAVVFGGKEDVIAKKGVLKGGKVGIKKLAKVGKKVKKVKKLKAVGKKLDKSLLKKSKKVGALGAFAKGQKKLAKVKAFSKIGGLGFKKKSFNVKSFNENKAFKFGKVKGFKLDKGLAAGVVKKGAKFKNLQIKGLKKKLGGGKKEIVSGLKLAQGGKKLAQVKKVGVKKGGKKLLKKKVKKLAKKKLG